MTPQFCVYVVIPHVTKGSPLAMFCVRCVAGIRVFQDHSDPKLQTGREERTERKEIQITVDLSDFRCWENPAKNEIQKEQKTKITTTIAKKSFFFPIADGSGELGN